LGRVNNNRIDRLLSEVKCSLAFDQPKLTAEIAGGKVVVEGDYLVVSEDQSVGVGGPLTEYAICIEFSPEYPRKEPKVFETGGCIPHENKYHINHDGVCCINVWEAWCVTSEDVSIQAYFSGPFKNFFLSQYVFAQTDHWPFGDYEHGRPGLIQAFSEVLGCRKNEDDIRLLLRLLKKQVSDRNWRRLIKKHNLTAPTPDADLTCLNSRITPMQARQMLRKLSEG
jgi:hypothetical protein